MGWFMPKTIGLERTVAKWLARARVARPDYEAGVKSPKEPWMEEAIKAKPTYKAAVTAPETPELFERGIKRAGKERWETMALKKGADRFVPGIELSEPYYRGQMTDILSEIERISIPERAPRGDIRNLDRVKNIFVGLQAWRLAKRSVGTPA
jgi:hypothetical protein